MKVLSLSGNTDFQKLKPSFWNFFYNFWFIAIPFSCLSEAVKLNFHTVGRLPCLHCRQLLSRQILSIFQVQKRKPGRYMLDVTTCLVLKQKFNKERLFDYIPKIYTYGKIFYRCGHESLNPSGEKVE
jgi:hypothetical protein